MLEKVGFVMKAGRIYRKRPVAALTAARWSATGGPPEVGVQQRKYFQRDVRGVHDRRLACPGQGEIVKCTTRHLGKDMVLPTAVG